MFITALIFLLILSVLVLIHELGHFLVAKKLGIKVEEFGFGLPPRVFGIRRGETLYSFNWLPIGGFVKLYGEDEAGGGKVNLPVSSKKKEKILNTQHLIHNTDIKRAFFARPVGQRASIVVAGVVMNALLAMVIYYIFLSVANFKTEMPLLTDHKFLFVSQTNRNIDPSDTVISAVSQDSPAERARIKTPSEVISVNGQNTRSRKFIIDTINKNRGKEVSLGLRDIKTNKSYTVNVVPRVTPPKKEGAVGIGFLPVAILSYETPAEKAFSGVSHSINLLLYTFDVMGRLISVSVQEKTAAPVSEGVAGPVGIFSLINTIRQLPDSKEQILGILNLAGILSISLAFFNVLPIPALDGGRLFFILIEGVFRKKISEKIESNAHAIGMAVLLALILLITLRDISRIFSSFSP